MRRYVLGLDEAGYGPKLGPLVVAASVWEIYDPHLPLSPEAIHHLVQEGFRRASTGNGKHSVQFADSKLLYKAGGSLSRLEEGVFAALGAAGYAADSWDSLCSAVHIPREAFPTCAPWYTDFDPRLPLATDPGSLAARRDYLQHALHEAGIKASGVWCRFLCAKPFNELLTRFSSKGEVLAYCSLSLLRELLATLEPAEVLILLDRQGGRRYYAGKIVQFFQDGRPGLVKVCRETVQRSCYQVELDARRVHLWFEVQAERYFPVAAASMFAKYLRELAMRAFTEYWAAAVPGIRATAGYGRDAWRFLAEIEPSFDRLGVDKSSVWRKK